MWRGFVISADVSGTGARLRLARWLASGLGSGHAPRAPGTAGSLASLPFAWLLLHAGGLGGLAAGWVALLALACWSTFVLLPGLDAKDPQWIVIDEWLGQWLALGAAVAWLGVTPLAFGLAFILFRLFDIAKPGPVGMAERMGPAWWAIHADDLAAGLCAAGVLGALAWLVRMAGGGGA